VLCAATLIFYKYTTFLTDKVIGAILPALGGAIHDTARALVPGTIPLGISFFTFEFVHYLIDLRRGGKPILSARDYAAFIFYWPTMVAGPIKRYQQFIPALHRGSTQASADDVMLGFIRVLIGFAKKWAADNLTTWIEVFEVLYATQTIGMRWLFLLAIAFRILLDFSGYSDMAIGFARMMGIVVPENFNWPYLARTPAEFWQRWHMSLSSWIRDYIYIPLGGNRFGIPRRIVNAMAAMLICGLWHGPDWNFAVWGLYHGLGLGVTALLQRRIELPSAAAMQNPSALAYANPMRLPIAVVSWAATMLFVAFGWLLFFYPVDKALRFALGLFGM
jgi:alginate O-acetyltransferase complex protein AlgI